MLVRRRARSRGWRALWAGARRGGRGRAAARVESWEASQVCESSNYCARAPLLGYRGARAPWKPAEWGRQPLSAWHAKLRPRVLFCVFDLSTLRPLASPLGPASAPARNCLGINELDL